MMPQIREIVIAICVMIILAVGQLSGTVQSQPLIITDMEWNPANGTIARAYSDGTVQVIERITETIAFEQLATPPVTKLTWNTDGTLLAVGVASDVLIWDVINDQLVYTLRASPITGTFQSEVGTLQEAVISLDWSDDNRLASLSRSGTLHIWDMVDRQLVVDSAVPQAASLSWKPDNAILITGSGLGLSTIDPMTGSLSAWRVDGGLTDSMTAIQWSPDGTRIASGNVFGQILVWDDTADGSLPILNAQAAQTYITDVAWRPDGSQLAASSENGIVRIYNAQTLNVIQSITHTGPVFAITWSPDGSELAYGGDDPDTSLNIIQNPAICDTTFPAGEDLD